MDRDRTPFGSLVKGRARAASDVDVALHLKGHATPSRRFDRRLELEARAARALGRPVEIVVLNDAPLELRFNVLAHGILISARDDAARFRFYVERLSRLTQEAGTPLEEYLDDGRPPGASQAAAAPPPASRSPRAGSSRSS